VEHYYRNPYPRNSMVQISTPGVTPNQGMGPLWGTFCHITLTSCLFLFHLWNDLQWVELDIKKPYCTVVYFSVFVVLVAYYKWCNRYSIHCVRPSLYGTIAKAFTVTLAKAFTVTVTVDLWSISALLGIFLKLNNLCIQQTWTACLVP